MEIKVNFLDKFRLEAKFDDFTVVEEGKCVTLARVWQVDRSGAACDRSLKTGSRFATQSAKR